MTPEQRATYIHDLTVIAQTAQVMLEIGVPLDQWYDLMHILRGRPEQKGPNRPPYFIYNGARIEPNPGGTDYGYRYTT